MNRWNFVALVAVFTCVQAQAKLITKNVEYVDKGIAFQGYLAFDDKFPGKRPGVLVVHDWMGQGEFSKKRAEALAALGYVGFSADIYGKGIRPANAKEAGELSGSFKSNRALLRQRVQLAFDELKKQAKVEQNKLAAIGYCFGGTSVLELGRAGADVNALVSFHGGLESPAPADGKNIKGKVLALHGADDPYVNEAEVKKFEDEMRAANVDWQLVKYSGAVHSFTNPAAGNDNSKGAAYNAKADERSWIAMKDFFAEVFKK